jgi:hypothetical protein
MSKKINYNLVLVIKLWDYMQHEEVKKGEVRVYEDGMLRRVVLYKFTNAAGCYCHHLQCTLLIEAVSTSEMLKCQSICMRLHGTTSQKL